MKRYLLFCWNDYEARGGWKDFKGDFDTFEQALIERDNLFDDSKWPDSFNCYQVIDSTNKQLAATNSLL